MAKSSNILFADMDEVSFDNIQTSSNSINLLILKELQMMRQDVVASMLRMEEQIKILNGKTMRKHELEKKDHPAIFDQSRISSTVAEIHDELFDDLNKIKNGIGDIVKCKEEIVYENEEVIPCSGNGSVVTSVEDSSIDENSKCKNGDEKENIHTLKECCNNSRECLYNKNHDPSALSKLNEDNMDISTVDKVDLSWHAQNIGIYRTRRYPCHLCGKTYSFSSGLSRHMRSHGNDYRFLCQICNSYFSTKDHLEKHMFIHKRDKKATSPEVNKSSSVVLFDKDEIPLSIYKKDKMPSSQEINKSSSLVLFDKDKVPLGSKTCPQCFRSYTTVGALNRHLRSHSNDRRFQCPICFKRFLRKEYLIVHMKQHY